MGVLDFIDEDVWAEYKRRQQQLKALSESQQQPAVDPVWQQAQQQTQPDGQPAGLTTDEILSKIAAGGYAPTPEPPPALPSWSLPAQPPPEPAPPEPAPTLPGYGLPLIDQAPPPQAPMPSIPPMALADQAGLVTGMQAARLNGYQQAPPAQPMPPPPQFDPWQAAQQGQPVPNGLGGLSWSDLGGPQNVAPPIASTMGADTLRTPDVAPPLPTPPSQDMSQWRMPPIPQNPIGNVVQQLTAPTSEPPINLRGENVAISADPYGTMQRNIAPVAELLQQNLEGQGPPAESVPVLGMIPAGYRALENAGGDIGQAWQDLGNQQLARESAGTPTLANAINPWNYMPAPEVGGAVSALAEGARGLVDNPAVRRGASAVNAAVTNPALEQLVPRLGLQDVGKGATQAERDAARKAFSPETVPKGINQDAAVARYEQLNQQYMSVQEKLAKVEEDIYAAQARREGLGTDLGIVRPPWAVGWTDAEITEVAGRMGRDPHRPDWGADPDTDILKDFNPLRQGGGKGKAMREANQEVARLTAEREALAGQARGLEYGMGQVLKAGEGQRAPIWEGKTAGAPPLREGPPAPPVEPPAQGLPSGKAPGGPQNVKPTEPVSDYERLVDALTPTKRTAREATRDAYDVLLRAMYDRVWDAHTIEDATGIPVHKLAQVVPGSISHGEFLVDSKVKPIFDAVGKDIKYLEQYMVTRRFEDVLARNPQAQLPGKVRGWGGTLRSLDEIKTQLGPERFAQIEDAAQQLWRLNDELVLKPRLEAGLLSKEQYTQIKSANPHYISFYREDFKGLQTGLGKGEANVSNAGIQAMEAAGSTRKLDNPLTRFEAQVINTRHLIAENEAARAIVTGLGEMERMAGEIGAAKGAAKVPLSSGEQFVKVLKPGQGAEHSNIWDTVSYFDNGQKVTAQVPTVYAKMAKGLEAESANFATKLARAATFPLRQGAVTWNVAFMPKNVIRDLISGTYREGLQPISQDYAGGWLAAITKNSDYADAARAGVLMSGIVETMRSTDALARANALGAITVRSPKDALLLIPRVIGRGLGTIEKAGIVSEQATRIATFKKLRAQGVNELDAAVRARDVTVDFAKAGNIMKVVNQIIPFSNAGLQGAANTLRTMRYNPKQALIGATPLAAVTVLAYLNNQRYETSKMIPEREYAMNWIVQFGEGTKEGDPRYPNKPPEKFPIYMRIPKGSIGGLLTAPIEMALRYAWANNDRSVLNDVGASLGTMATSLAPVDPSFSGILPPLAGTGVGIETGYDAFRGQPIVPKREQDRPPELQYGPGTSREAIALGERFHVSPRMIDWAIKDMAGGVGSQTLWLSDLILGAIGYNPTPFGEAKTQAPSDAERIARAPVTGGFVGVQNSQTENTGWDRFDKAVQEAQRTSATNPEMKRLGLTIGAVSEKAAVGDYSIVLTPQERADLQDATAKVLVGLVPKVMASESYKQAPDALKVKALQAVMDMGREATRNAFLSKLPREGINQRILESLPVPVGGRR